MFWPFNTQRGAYRFSYRMIAAGYHSTIFYNDRIWKVYVR